MKKIRGLYATLSVVLISTSALALNLDQLSECEEIGRLIEAARSSTHACRAPQGRLERFLADRLGSNPRARLCFLPSGPTRPIEQFSCFLFQFDSSREMSCFRSVPWRSIVEYKENYMTTHAARARRYLDAAANCRFSNGDASEIGGVTMPQTIAWIARLDVGFIMPLGRTVVGSGAVIHGYGLVDPQLSQGQAAIEFVSVRP
jgi:hypothetical protein